MFRLATSNRFILDVVVALTLIPLAAVCLAGIRAAGRIRRRSAGAAGPIAISITACALAAWLAASFVLPKLSNDHVVESRAGLLALARAAQAGRWLRGPLQPVVDHARQRHGLEDLAELLSLTTSGGQASGAHAPDALFVGGGRLGTDRTGLTRFDGWSTHDPDAGHCELIVYFTPTVALSGSRLWLHEYPEGSHEYVDITISLPSRDWAPDEFAWEVFRTAGAGRFTVYAGIQDGQDLGPALLLGHVDRCGV